MTTTEEEEQLELTRLDLLRAYNRVYYHTHKQASDCEHCGKTYSSKSALTRHQQRNLKCQILQLKSKTREEAPAKTTL